jgi:hypothetical protein
MGNYESCEISLPLGRKVRQVVNISPLDPKQKLDPSFNQVYRITKNDNLQIDEMSGRLTITETGATFAINICALDSSEMSGVISLDIELLVLSTEEHPAC